VTVLFYLRYCTLPVAAFMCHWRNTIRVHKP
jgi:hypothetical protein